MRIGLIGLGGMGKVVVTELQKADGDSVLDIVGAIVAPEDLTESRQSNKSNVPVLDDFQALLALQPDVIAECAGHDAVRQYGEHILGAEIGVTGRWRGVARGGLVPVGRVDYQIGVAVIAGSLGQFGSPEKSRQVGAAGPVAEGGGLPGGVGFYQVGDAGGGRRVSPN